MILQKCQNADLLIIVIGVKKSYAAFNIFVETVILFK